MLYYTLVKHTLFLFYNKEKMLVSWDHPSVDIAFIMHTINKTIKDFLISLHQQSSNSFSALLIIHF